MEHKYPRIERLGGAESEGIFSDEIVVESKIDGCNMSCYVENESLIFRSRNRILGNKVDEKTFKKAAKFVTGQFILHPDKFDPTVIYFFEGMFKHTINYDFENSPFALGFDVLHKESGMFFDWNIAKLMFEKIGVQFVPILFVKNGKDVKIDELCSLVETQKSQFSKNELEEGVVIKNYKRLNRFNRPLFAKLTRTEFKEANKLIFSGLKELRDTEKKIVEEYATPARIIKIIHKLMIEEGHELSMKLMPVLYKRVSDDILSEEILNIQQKYSSLHFKEFTNMVAAKCAKELKTCMINSEEVKC